MAYDNNNIFARILRREIPANVIFEDDYVLSFRDIQPQAPCHVLVIPKGAYENQADFMRRASDSEILGFNRAMAAIIEQLDIEKTGYRLISNCGVHGGQEVPHFHVHILAGRALGRMLGGA